MFIFSHVIIISFEHSFLFSLRIFLFPAFHFFSPFFKHSKIMFTFFTPQPKHFLSPSVPLCSTLLNLPRFLSQLRSQKSRLIVYLPPKTPACLLLAYVTDAPRLPFLSLTLQHPDNFISRLPFHPYHHPQLSHLSIFISTHTCHHLYLPCLTILFLILPHHHL